MKRGLTILTAVLFVGALALPAMAQSTDSGANKEAPAASAVTNPGTMGTENAAKPSADNGAVKADDNAAKADNGEMKQEQKPADDSSAQQKKTDSDTGNNPAGATTAGHPVE